MLNGAVVVGSPGEDYDIVPVLSEGIGGGGDPSGASRRRGRCTGVVVTQLPRSVTDRRAQLPLSVTDRLPAAADAAADASTRSPFRRSLPSTVARRRRSRRFLSLCLRARARFFFRHFRFLSSISAVGGVFCAYVFRIYFLSIIVACTNTNHPALLAFRSFQTHVVVMFIVL